MGNACSSGCSNSDVQYTSETERINYDSSRLELGSMHIHEFESRVKKYAHPINKGKVSIEQLMQAFEDKGTFEQLRNPFSVVYKLLLSPFFRNLPLKHYQKNEAALL